MRFPVRQVCAYLFLSANTRDSLSLEYRSLSSAGVPFAAIAPVVNYNHIIRFRGLLHIMRCKEHRHPGFPLQLDYGLPHALSCLRIKAGGRSSRKVSSACERAPSRYRSAFADRPTAYHIFCPEARRLPLSQQRGQRLPSARRLEAVEPCPGSSGSP